MVKTAVIMAAGLGSRFGQYTERIPKGFIECGGVPMIERSIRTLIECGIDRIIVGTGYHKEKFEDLALQYSQIEKTALFMSSVFRLYISYLSRILI